MNRRIARTLGTLLVVSLALVQTAGVAAHTCADGDDDRCPTAVTAADPYDVLIAQQEVFIQTVVSRSVALAATASYDDLMAQQDEFIADAALTADRSAEMQPTPASN